MSGVPITLVVNGEERTATAEPRTTLADFLRSELGLTGTHTGCEHGVCGSCTVLFDAEPVRACLMLAVQAAGRQVTTIEGLAADPAGRAIQSAMRDKQAFQCGFCTPGILTTTRALLDGSSGPLTRDEIRKHLSGNLCRCSGYQPIVDAVVAAAGSESERGQPPACSVPNGGRLVGTRAPRKEDLRILVGGGRYVGDISPRGVLHAHFVRSPHPHARIVRIDTGAAKAAPGVAAVLTGFDLDDIVAPLDFHVPFPGLVTPAYPALASERVRFVGDPVALVVAESRALAEDAADLVDIEYEPLPSVATVEQATRSGAVQLHAEVAGNLAYEHEMSSGPIEEAFARADRVIADSIDLHRWAPTPMETRGGVADYDASSQMLTYEVSCQSPHLTRFVLSTALRHPQHLLRVSGPDVGGSFGLKWSPYREDVLVCAAARQLKRPVKWIEDRVENLSAAGHGRDHRVDLQIVVTNDGAILGMRADITINAGAYAAMPSAAVTCGLIRTSLPGPYRIGAFAARSRVVLTNTASHVSLRGPWAIETLARERALDLVARELGLTPVQVRERNLLTREDQPAEIPSGHVLTNVTAHETFARALTEIDYATVQAKLEESRRGGNIVGFGMATSIEPAPATPSFFAAVGFPFVGEAARVRMEPDGGITVFTAQQPHGQGHETTLAQLVADTLGVSLDDVRVVTADTQITPFNMVGTGGSRAATFASGAAIMAARELRRKVQAIVAKMLEADPGDIELSDGCGHLRRDPHARVRFADMAAGAYMAPTMMPEGVDLELEAAASYDGEGGGFSQSTHCCWVEIDGETGQIVLPRYLIVEDCGPMINPGVVEGQIRGATAMGLSGMLLENIVYDAHARCLTTSFFDYLPATAVEIPDIDIEHLESASELLVASRGVGEGGAIAAPAALANALDDAVIAAGGKRIGSTPFTPARVLEALGVLGTSRHLEAASASVDSLTAAAPPEHAKGRAV
ncbi:MAG: molybdopterin-dependent oxidoreductase [Solirubrobacterales bacterium]|nr:molybdopterin-dependent oxidoreductase [Solirubrobacterales bacterium]